MSLGNQPVSEDVYLNNETYKQMELLCVPTTLSMIIEDYYGYEYKPLELLKTILYDSNNEFYVNNEKTREFYREKGLDFSINESNNGLIINKDLTRSLMLVDYVVKVEKEEYYPYLDKQPLVERFYTAKNLDENLSQVKDTCKFYKDIGVTYYLIAYLDYYEISKGNKKRKENANYNHCVIIQSINEKEVSLLVPKEDDYVDNMIVPYKKFIDSMLSSGKSFYGISIISNVKK